MRGHSDKPKVPTFHEAFTEEFMRQHTPWTSLKEVEETADVDLHRYDLDAPNRTQRKLDTLVANNTEFESFEFLYFAAALEEPMKTFWKNIPD